REGMSLDARRHNRRSHARLGRLLLAGFVDRPVRELNGAGQRPGVRGDTLKMFSHLAIVSALSGHAEIIQQNVHGHLTGYFAGGLPSHAVANDKNPEARVVPEVIFVVRTHATYVTLSGNLNRKRHCPYVGILS